MVEFKAWPKIPRLENEKYIITEKIDGTNGCIYIGDVGGAMLVGSRSRWITPANDNHGFARWAYDHAEELQALGPGRHFGEWWGQGINRGYGLKEKHFSLFNVKKWASAMDRPACCEIVPVLASGDFTSELVLASMDMLMVNGSFAAPGFMRPEGIVIYHTAGNLLFKKTFENDEKGKGE